MSNTEDRLKKAFAAMVAKVMRRVDYLGMYPATVLTDHGDNTVDLEPDDTRIAKLVKVPIALFIPGAKITVKKDARVLLGWDSGNPAKPRAYLWQSGDLDTLKIIGETLVVVECPDVRMGTEAGAKALAFADQTDARLGKLESDWGTAKGVLIAAVGSVIPPLGEPFVAGGTPPGGTVATELVKGE